MSLFGSIAREFKGADGLTWGEISTLWAGLFGTYQSRSGVAVGWKRALHVSTFLACTRRIAEAVSTVPTKVYKKHTTRSHRRADGRRPPRASRPARAARLKRCNGGYRTRPT
jgi:hypothetical protein